MYNIGLVLYRSGFSPQWCGRFLPTTRPSEHFGGDYGCYYSIFGHGALNNNVVNGPYDEASAPYYEAAGSVAMGQLCLTYWSLSEKCFPLQCTLPLLKPCWENAESLEWKTFARFLQKNDCLSLFTAYFSLCPYLPPFSSSLSAPTDFRLPYHSN